MGYAPWYIVPNKHFVSIENPFIIKNVDNGIETMGGVKKLQEVVKIWPRHLCIGLMGCAVGPGQQRSSRKSILKARRSDVQTFEVCQCQDQRHSTKSDSA